MRFASVKHGDSDKKQKLKEVIESIKNGDNVYILIHNVNCPPCKATYPEWIQLESRLFNKYPTKSNILVADVEDTLVDGINANDVDNPILKPYVGDIDGVPTMKLIKDNGNTKQPYESSNISKKDRSLNSFAEWIESNISPKQKNKQSSSPQELLERLSASDNFVSNRSIRSKKYNHNQKKKKTKKGMLRGGGKRKNKSSKGRKRKTKTRKNK